MGRESIINEIIPALDNFDAAFSNKEAWLKVDDAWRMGVEYIYSQFINILENNGIVQFGNEGDVFNELLHLSVENIQTENTEQNGTIAILVQKGYKNGDKIIREAKVKTFIN
jgi:molecular chaperone GrpE